ncbi:hypothetical protein HKX48_000216 [Thoreauomyces humboldtii]|nr:hypothetical protein HKX48_000216 [Thoreauomyces humboldtii]
MIRTLNVDPEDPLSDIPAIEEYTQQTIAPEHRKLIARYVEQSASDIAAQETPLHREGAGSMSSSPAQTPPVPSASTRPSPKRKRASRAKTGAATQEQMGLPPTAARFDRLLFALESHLLQSPVTRHLRKDVDFRLAIAERDDGRREGVWRCIVCNSRPITVSFRRDGTRPQVSNISAHLRTPKHLNVVEERRQKAIEMEMRQLADNLGSVQDPTAVAAVTAALARHFEEARSRERPPF